MDKERMLGVVPMTPRVAGWGYGVDYYPEVLPYKEEYTPQEYDFLLEGDFSTVTTQLPKTYPVIGTKGTVVDGAAFAMVYFKRECFKKIGLLDENFFPGCFLPNEQVLMGDLKYRAIKDIKEGELVIGKYGKRCPVNKVIPKPYKGKILELSFVGTTEKVRLTPDHKIFAVSKTGGRGKRSVNWSRIKKEIKEVEVKNLLPRDLVFCPRPIVTSVRVGGIYGFKEDFRIYGYFLAEGSYIKKMTKKGKKYYGLSFSFNINEKEYIKEVFEYFKGQGVSVSLYERPTKTITTIEVYSKEVAERYMELFGEYSWGKSIGKKLLTADTSLLRELVITYSYGDGGMCRGFKKGHSKKDYNQLKMKSVSKQLITDIRNILLKLGIPSLLYIKTNVRQRSRRPAHELYISQNYLNRLYGLPDDERKKTPRNEVFEENDRIFYPIKEIKELDYEGTVYDLNVGIDHSYIVGIMTGHNSGEDYDMLARIYREDFRLVSTSYSWVWHHWTKSKDLFASGELEDPYYKNRPYWVNLGDLWRPEDNMGHEHDVWGKWTDSNGRKHPLVRVPEIHVEMI
jgi:hypothetical protein